MSGAEDSVVSVDLTAVIMIGYNCSFLFPGLFGLAYSLNNQKVQALSAGKL